MPNQQELIKKSKGKFLNFLKVSEHSIGYLGGESRRG